MFFSSWIFADVEGRGSNLPGSQRELASRCMMPLRPALARAVGAVERAPLRTSVRDRPPQRIRRAAFATGPRAREDERVQRRYGTANEPPPHFVDNQPREGRAGTTDAPARQSPPTEEADTKKAGLTPAEELPGKEEKASAGEAENEDEIGDDMATKEAANALGQDPASTVASKPDAPPKAHQAPSSKPLETVLNMPAPEHMESDKPPQLHPPPYVHHFDTYGLVQRLDSGGFTNDQSTTIMKAVRTILVDNMDLARRGLVSKSNVENETYLFKAACSELKTELENNRKGELDKNRTRRSLLQHEVDILGQKITQDVSGLRDELKGMFDDRKMTQRNEQRNMENRVGIALSLPHQPGVLTRFPRYKSSTTRSPSHSTRTRRRKSKACAGS